MAVTQVGKYTTVSGFGTFGGVVTDEDDAQFRTDLRQPRGADRTLDLGVDSRLGLQANVTFNDTFSLVGQVLESRRDTYRPALEWLYGQANLPAGFTLKLGRMVLPTFMVSESRSVGYAQHWLRAPQEVYAQYPASSYDGGQLQYTATLGRVNLTAQLAAGQTKSDVKLLGLDTELDFQKLRAVNLVLETGDWLFRVGETRGNDTKIDVFPGLKLDDKFTGVGVQYDNGTLLVMGEYTKRRQLAPVPFDNLFESDSWYVSSGWRFGAWMPYVTVSRLSPIGPLYGAHDDDKGIALGVRWDAMKNVAIKAQAQKVEASDRTTFVNASAPPTTFAADMNAFSIAADFVF